MRRPKRPLRSAVDVADFGRQRFIGYVCPESCTWQAAREDLPAGSSHAVSSKKEKPSRLPGFVVLVARLLPLPGRETGFACADERNDRRDFIMRLVINGRRLKNLVISGDYICPGIRKCAAGRVSWS
jgi:hypothetical protein